MSSNKEEFDNTIKEFCDIFSKLGKGHNGSCDLKDLQNITDKKRRRKQHKRYELKDQQAESNPSGLLNILIDDLKKLQNKKKNQDISDTDLVEAYEIILPALMAPKMILTEGNVELINDFEKRIYKEYRMLSQKTCGTDNFSIIQKHKYGNSKDLSYVNTIIQNIKPDDDARSKVNNYINKVFVSLFSSWFAEKTKNFVAKDVLLVFENALNKGSSKKKNDMLAKYNAKFKKKNDYDLSNEEMKERIAWFRENGDIQQWFGIFKKSSEKDALGCFKDLYSNNWYSVFSVFTKLNSYRNMVLHLGTSEPSTIWVVFVIKTIIEFCKFSKLKIQSCILIKHLFYERYVIFNENKRKKYYTYSDVDYRHIQEENIEHISDWRRFFQYINFNDCLDKKIEIGTELFQRAEFVSNFFFKKLDSDVLKNAINEIRKYYKNNGFFFTPFVMGENFDKLLEAGYPFHPAFFVLTKGLSLSEVLKLAKRAIENDLKSQERHAMIMPFCILPTDDSTNKTELDDAVYKEFSSTDSFEKESTQCEGWKIFKKIELDCDDGYVIKNCSFPILVHNIAKTIVLINLYQWYLPKSNSSFKATRDVIRFCVLDTNTPDKNFEEAMDWLEENSFLLEHNSAIYFYKTISDFEKQNKLLFYLPYNYVGVKYEQVLFFHIKKSIKKKFPKANVIQYCSENSISEVKKDVCNVFLLSQYMDINRPECFPLLKVLKNEDKIFEVTPLFETFNDIILPLRCLWFYSIICEVTKKGKDNLFSQAEKVEKICWENVDINSLVRELNYAKA